VDITIRMIMMETEQHTNYLPHTLVLLMFLVLDFMLIVGLFWHGKANFLEVFKHLK